MAKLFVHIGLPKTATTSLQRFFYQRLVGVHESPLYVGVRQPRGLNQTKLYELWISALNGLDVSPAKEELRLRLEDRKSLLISEEMVLVSDPRSTWSDKLHCLSQITKSVETEIIVTIREPLAAMFSYYVELFPLIIEYSGADHDEVGFVQRALFDPAMKIFHYKKLFEEIEKYWKMENIHIFTFDEITKGDLTSIASLLKCSPLEPGQCLPKTNSRDEDATHVTVERHAGGRSICKWRVRKPNLGELRKVWNAIKSDTKWLAEERGVRLANHDGIRGYSSAGTAGAGQRPAAT